MPAMAAPSHQFMFDGTPEVKDVVLQKRIGSPAIFRTVLVSSLRGAPAYMAMDVTFPESPVFLWQVSFADVGETIGNATVTQVEVDWQGERQQRAVAILPGGEGVACNGPVATRDGETRAQYPRGNSRDVRCWNRRGRALYVVDVATGEILQQFGPEHFPSPLSGSVVVDSNGVTAASAAYFFDHDGILWRLSMVSSDPQNWKAAPIYDMFADPAEPSVTTPRSLPYQLGHAPVYAPTLTRDTVGNLVILAGTGNPDSPRDSARHRVVSLTEKRGALEDGEISAEIALNWRIDLRENEAVTGPLTVFQDVAYFSTFQSLASSGNCGLGTSRLWGAHAYLAVDKNASPPAPVPRLLGSNSGTADRLQLEEKYNDNSLVIGATVKQQPICLSSSVLVNAATQQTVSNGASGGGAYQLTGLMAGGSAGGQTRGGDTSHGAVVETNPQNIRVVNTTKVTSWASMFE
jgi:type IV pilus assembly protein PilY1